MIGGLRGIFAKKYAKKDTPVGEKTNSRGIFIKPGDGRIFSLDSQKNRRTKKICVRN
ncbi:hypothetical protein HMPREF0293_1970 [Corynebacterium glucuronolyticum ATCC 51866]|uniref:Uncharacterized protein n=1 Tax=Corynebacterium glucuronolyticum ATCC 51866 TaxID=548478 RepID=A0ABP2DWG3_9CORY|nr:hypothetical protein HMPREF0293_1970 [Corynebacterium glucuronolyticum ATCC 51866]